MQSVGEKLKKARREKNLSLDEVYRQLKIHSRVLGALEQDRAHNFLNPVYVKGFLKTYARFLGLDGEKLLKEYIDSQKTEAQAQPQPVEPAIEKKDKKDKTFPPVNPFLIFRIAAAVLLAVGLIFYFRYVLKNISTARKQAESRPKVKVAVMPARSRIGQAGEPAPAVKTEDLILEVRTLDACWMRVVADNQTIFEKTLAKGKSERWLAAESIELRIGKPEALKVFVNGKPIDLKKMRVKKRLTITQEGIKGK